MVTILQFRKLIKANQICYKRKGQDKNDCEHTECSYQRKRNHLMLKFLWDTGARISEVAGVRIKDLDPTKNQGNFDDSYTKRNKSRPFKLDEQFYKELKVFNAEEQEKWNLKDDDTIFHNYKGTPIAKDSIYRIIKKLIHRALDSDSNITPHSFRRSFATY